MVSQVKDTPLFDTMFQWLKNDFRGMLTGSNTLTTPVAGLYTYPVEFHNGGKMRIHLRVEPNGGGVLFVDVTEAVHLNPTAVMIAKMALDNVPLARAKATLLSQYWVVDRQAMLAELNTLYALIDQLRNYEEGCITCNFGDKFELVPLFGVEVNAPYKVDVALTYGCNDECPHCYNEVNRFGMPSLKLEDWHRVFDRIAEIGVPHVILTGGEATLHPDLPEIIHYADQLGMIVGMNTNGRHLAHKPYMQELADAGLNHVQITLGSQFPEIHNAMMGSKSFDQRVRGIQNAVESRVHTITNTTLMRRTSERVEEFIDFLYDLGIRTFAMNGMIYSGGGFQNPNAIPEKELQPLLVRVRDHAKAKDMRFLWYTVTEYCRLSPVELDIGVKRCNAGEYSLCIEPNGDVLPCQSYYVSAGNILNDPWERIWQGDLFRSFREREETPQLSGLEEKCWECPDLPLCGGGCRIEREAREGNRVANAGSGCFGCGSGLGRVDEVDVVYAPTGGFVPGASVTNSSVRASGNMPLISLDDIAVNDSL
ncbi:MAG: radical SAM protein [Anaerolineales bacterium]|nr:radical SAM protein [Anaerolineales bacterium]